MTNNYINFNFAVIYIMLAVILAFLLSSCTHTGTVVFKGYSPAEYSIGYRPSRIGKGIIKGYVFYDSYNYVIIQTKNGRYEKIQIARNDIINEGDQITKHTLYYDDIPEMHIRMIENLNQKEKWK